jgi:hypothetical protein
MERYFVVEGDNVSVFSDREDMLAKLNNRLRSGGAKISEWDFEKDNELLYNDDIIVIFGKLIKFENKISIIED